MSVRRGRARARARAVDMAVGFGVGIGRRLGRRWSGSFGNRSTSMRVCIFVGR